MLICTCLRTCGKTLHHLCMRTSSFCVLLCSAALPALSSPRQMLDRLLSSWDVASPGAQLSVEGCLAEVEDLLSYCNDVLMTGPLWLRSAAVTSLERMCAAPAWAAHKESVRHPHQTETRLHHLQAWRRCASCCWTASGRHSWGPSCSGRSSKRTWRCSTLQRSVWRVAARRAASRLRGRYREDAWVRCAACTSLSACSWPSLTRSCSCSCCAPC